MLFEYKVINQLPENTDRFGQFGGTSGVEPAGVGNFPAVSRNTANSFD
jgi:hypothetical protein